MTIEMTLLIVKAGFRGQRQKILKYYQQEGLNVVNIIRKKFSKEEISDHYSHLSDKVFFIDLINYMTSETLYCYFLIGENASVTARKITGETNPDESDKGTVRADFVSDYQILSREKQNDITEEYKIKKNIQSNVVHCSESLLDAEKEMKNLFTADEISGYKIFINNKTE